MNHSAAVPPEVTEDMRGMLADAGITDNADLVARILATGIGLGLDRADRLDLKIASAALTEMRAAFRLFAPYEDLPKATIFGSARTLPDDALYRQASEVAAALAASGWMVVTGAGPGIMQAAAEGAGAHNSLGVSIRLPFEEKPNAIVGENARNVTMKYFFTRKLMLVKESKLRSFVDDHLLSSGVISEGDFDRVVVTDSVESAVAALTGFYRNYDSLRWVGKRLVLRLKSEPTDAEVSALNAEFGALLAEGRIERRGPLTIEREDDDRVELPRLVLRLNQFRVGELYRLIAAVNALDSAPPA
ncbi:MAG: log [Microbacterium sp.]|nr:log [Microbacterium sp.]